MNTFTTHRTTKSTLLAAGLLVLALTGGQADAVDTSKTQTAVRPEAIGSVDGYGTPGYYPGSYGQPMQQPYQRWSAPEPTNVYPSGASCPNCNCPNGQCNNCPNGQCSHPNTNAYPYGVNYLDSTAYPFDQNTNYLPPQYQLDVSPANLQRPFDNGRYRDPSIRPVSTYPYDNGATNWCPTGTCPLQNRPASSYPASTYPSNTYPSNTYPSNTYPSNTYPSNGGYTVPVNTYPTNNQPQLPNYQPQPTRPSIPRQVEDDADAKITARYQNSEMLAFLNRMNLNQAMNLYVEASRLIDSRHVSPASYEVRTRKALENLDRAVQNPTFLRAAGANADATRIAALRQELAQLAQSNPARTSNEAIGLMQWAADLANQRIGVRREAVALEFFNGSLDSLDKYTAFVPSKQAFGMNTDGVELKSALLEENIVGVGIEMKQHDQGALVMGTVEGGPAHRARIERGDILTGVDGRTLAGMSLSQIANLVGGPAGSPVTFRVNRNGQEFTASMRRENVYVSSVASAQMLDRETGYMRLKQFSESSAEDLEKAMWKLYRTGMRTLVLDLRGNPGGLLTESIQVSNLFIPSGRIVATKGRTASDDSDERATWEKTWKLPLVVLVDENSASASEIFAAAVQENQRGVIVGRTTYGKGTVQTHFPLQSVTGNLKLTTAKFYSPSGREMSDAGVRPDVMVNGNGDDNLTAAIHADQDVRTALDVIARGTPASLATNSQQNRPTYDLSQLGD